VETYHILLSSITVHYAASSHLNEGIKLLAKTKGKNLDLLVEAKEGFEFTNTKNDREPQETHQRMNPKPKSESEATCGIYEINLDLPHNLIGNIIFRCIKGPQETQRMYKNSR
jgi:hypothetical protein